MITLPPALAPWSEQLALFPQEVAVSLAPWLPRMAMAFGLLRHDRKLGDGEPDGYSGLARKGSLERLLTTEWLLATEMPDEFVRRVAMNELSYLELARLGPAGAPRCVALFDAGPNQLGSPRIAHLAALIVLARRAEDAGAGFCWDVIQSANRSDLYRDNDLNKASVMRLLQARCAEEVQPADLDQWLFQLELSEMPEPDDLWLIGGEHLRSAAEHYGASFVGVEDVLEPAQRRLSVSVARRATPPLSLDLELPEVQMSTRLLRDPFEVRAAHVPKRTVGALQEQLLFSSDGRRLFLPTAGGVVAHTIPNSPGAQLALPRNLDARGEKVVAAGSQKKQYYLVTSNGERLSILGFSRRGRLRDVWPLDPFPPDHPFWHPGSNTPIQPCIIRWKNDYLQFAFLDAVGRLYAVSPQRSRDVKLAAWGVTGLGYSFGRILVGLNQSHDLALLTGNEPFERDAPERRVIVELDGVGDLSGLTSSFTGDGDLTLYFGPDNHAVDRCMGRVAVRTGREEVTMYGRSEPYCIPVSPHQTIIGLACGPSYRVGLVTMRDRRVFWLLSDDEPTVLHTADDDVLYASIAAKTSNLAYVTESEIAVYAPLRQQVVLRFEIER